MKMANLLAVGLALTLAAPAFAQGQGQGRPGGGRGFGGFGFRGGFDGGATGLLRIPEVQKELKLDQTQVELLDQLNKEMDDKRRAMFQSGGDLTPEQRRERFTQLRPQMEKLQQDQEKKVAEVLDAKQMARLKQLGIQRAGIQALSRTEVQDQLKLSADQRQKIAAAQQQMGEAMRTLFQPGANGQRPSREQFAELRTKMDQMRAQNDAKILAILTAPQKQQFEAMKGAPFTFPERRGGFGGREGRGRGQRGGNNT